ncbi:MAG: TonB-dependent siderophore receptor [Candidatus Dactylopiibacterium carminicum]|uniref:TonB-dependent siderophore receptor n=1 Tax=Candidatus Dactylopiibacterium carminicum TaxID=857335 RepID=A0A272EV28_9RHOO|nr:FepA family TonB-dependent siderophore receptor [Candidatus Dactylopiibacterium carminicum]KAF7599852.1 TonB-dependent siderophore receptor [Candidatus Dactylopiibacterium carminicum]PAS93963.1 MAG: TonB-dependent siderophore receptor [Candidatus Dactylopiibacterium carminicum]PAS97278.1 MAG: TonB-dependent siderophore receptor [Candidatus Dactylopiibacterium carminicum]PAS99852.1 MAG: outer membrane receptor protein [Candidatus Dactylopiibacterium carminicum]
MSKSNLFKLKPIAVALALLPGAAVHAQEAAETTLDTVKVTATAEETLKQMPGVSTITAEDIEKRPPVNDLSDIIRRMPGVNLTGNSSTGARGNNRQIDLRGMGPENTLILIDGKPVTSRNSVRYSRNGERDTRGDSNWVPVEEVERIEVIRGPAAARYGNGAAGGVVNIITKGIPDELRGSVSLYTNQPEDSAEGDTNRVNFNLSGPINEQLGFRVYGNYNKTDADAPDINVGQTAPGVTNTAAGREGVKNEDVKATLRWKPVAGQTVDFDAGYSRQGNIYAGDTNVGSSATDPNAATGTNPASFLGEETNTMTRTSYAVTHKGDWSFGKSSAYFQYENTKNKRLGEGAAGSGEGNINTTEKFTSELNGYTLNGQVDVPFQFGFSQMLTAGVEWNHQKLDDPRSIQAAVAAGISWPGVLPADQRPTDIDATITSFFVEDNIELISDLLLTPGLRLDHHSEFGDNWSPSLNASYMITDEVTLKGGVARAFKAPNLYQINPYYLYNSMGNGCPVGMTNPCYVLGNADLDPEVSLNKEIGINYTHNGWNAGLTYFHNKYDNKITSGMTNLNTTGLVTGSVLQWENATDATIAGYEANLLIPLAHNLNWSNNATYMSRNKDQRGQPLSIIPKYTVNTTLDWAPTDALSFIVTGTFYGKQKPRTTAASTGAAVTDSAALRDRPAYQVWGIGAGYTFNRHLKGRIGISNLFDKQLFREGNGSAAGANTYNEPGRAYYATLTASF